MTFFHWKNLDVRRHRSGRTGAHQGVGGGKRRRGWKCRRRGGVEGCRTDMDGEHSVAVAVLSQSVYYVVSYQSSPFLARGLHHDPIRRNGSREPGSGRHGKNAYTGGRRPSHREHGSDNFTSGATGGREDEAWRRRNSGGIQTMRRREEREREDLRSINRQISATEG